MRQVRRPQWERAIWASTLPCPVKLTALALAACAADGIEASPTVAEIGSMTGFTSRTTLWHLQRLNHGGWLEVRPEPGTVTTRVLTLPIPDAESCACPGCRRWDQTC
jgi:hypothetical protein